MVKTTNKNSLKSKQKLLRKCGPFWLPNIWFLLQCYTLNLCSLSLQTGFFEGHILSWTDEISEEWPSGVNRFSTHITHLFPQPPLNNFQNFSMIVLCSSSFSNNVSNHCITMITFTTTCTSGLWGFTFTAGQIGSYWHRHCRHLTVLNWNDGGESKMFVKSSMWGLPSPIISSWHYKLHYWNPWSLSTATGAVGNTALVCIFVYRWGWNGCTY